jgi:aspartate-semialdehyde dehydrogenase
MAAPLAPSRAESASPPTRVPVGILGATGTVGQEFIAFLAGHPWFEVTWLGASGRSAGKRYSDATTWRLTGDLPARFVNLPISECHPGGDAPRLVFSALDASAATEIEQAFAQAGHTIVSNARNHRMEGDVPLLIPDVNADHLGLLARQRTVRGWAGQIVTNPNCATVALAMSLAPLKVFGIRRIIVTTMQALSGAGYPGVPSLDSTANVIPYIAGEEQKLEQEVGKILGGIADGVVTPLDATVSASCNRVPVVDGHLISVSVDLADSVTETDLVAAWRHWRGVPQEMSLPSAPPFPVVYLDAPDRPQPRRDAGRDRGMTVSVGRLRRCPVLGWKFTALVHNTVRGAAGAAVLNAELLHAGGWLLG